ncbi:tail assembly chaperone [Lactobacillus mulieris]|jgi:hypothetical protein|uniref:Tail assembly chaperone n=1 Tax=Lactobacillus mulieris TaxID=2508708 RepID=A0ABT4K1K0_9LACO|nr:tail assembly chaperone [Lactobacillus mulieris]MCZ3621867.1 tail assembly chaperone [Lactobacillus mulieris]MCZ3623564.1 tail assembly chaperone [Lactobacillus mulieris]MCZ3635874.1 tail assembly chaperone [Lactobacillus mulieris]DAT07824.1 MAG TPA: tail assembly chaperone [Caudoviricetes sp.]
MAAPKLNLTINGTDVELVFGVRFVHELNKAFGIERDGFNIGMGFTLILPPLLQYDPDALAKVIYCAAYKNSPRPTMGQIYDSLDELEDLEQTFDEVMDCLKVSSATKRTLATLTVKEQAEEQKSN